MAEITKQKCLSSTQLDTRNISSLSAHVPVCIPFLPVLLYCEWASQKTMQKLNHYIVRRERKPVARPEGF